MTSTTHITIASEDELAEAVLSSSRVLTFPDGITRHITLTNGQWANYDALLVEGWPPEKLLWVPWDSAREFVETGQAEDFEEELRCCMVTWGKGLWSWRADRKKNRPANISTQQSNSAEEAF